METQEIAEWLAGMPVLDEDQSLSPDYLLLTINTREFFLREATKGKEQVALHMLHGINELHLTLAN